MVIVSQTLKWGSNYSRGEITADTGPARTSAWGFFSLPHGSYSTPEIGSNCSLPGDCGDGFNITSELGVIYAIGGWIDTNMPPAKVAVFPHRYPFNGGQCELEGSGCNRVSAGESPVFVAVVEPGGFTKAEFRELEGKTEGPFEADIKLIFADDFTIALGRSEAMRAMQVPIGLALAIGFASFIVSSGLYALTAPERA